MVAASLVPDMVMLVHYMAVKVMDRASITRHLLSDTQDPFNRMPLTVEMLQPNTELKAEIEGWVR